MKRLLSVLLLCVAFAARAVVSDIKIPQQSLVSPPTFKDVIISPTANSLLGFNASKVPSDVTIGTGLGLSGGVLSVTAAGSVTSVGLAMPSIFTVTNSPITTNGDLTASLNTEAANLVFAGPTTGAATIPTFRALVDADIPTALSGKTYEGNTWTAGSNTLTLGGNLTLTGAFATTFTVTGTTSVTLPTSGTLATTSATVASFSAGTTGLTPNSATTGAVTLAGTLASANGGTGVNNGSSTITLGGSLTLSGAFASTFTVTGATTVTFPTSGTLATVAGTVPAYSGLTTNGVLQATGATTVASTLTPSGLTSVSSASFQTSSSAFNAQTGTSYTIQSSDNGKVVTLNNSSAIALTIPSGLGAGFSCTIVQLGAGQVTVTGSGATVGNAYSNTKLFGQYAVGTLTAYLADTFVLAGDTSQ